jgi:hypothetical protein
MRRLQRAAELVAILSALGHRSALVGGLAVSARARERFTKDMDFAVETATDAEAETLAIGLQRRGLRLHTIIEQEATGRLATMRFLDPSIDPTDPTIDLLCASSGIEPEIVANATITEVLPGLALPVACLPHLIAMKTLSVSEVRGQDQSDLRALLSRASPAELQAARVAAALIEQRGFHRNRDLVSDLDRWIATVRGVTPGS